MNVSFMYNVLNRLIVWGSDLRRKYGTKAYVKGYGCGASEIAAGNRLHRAAVWLEAGQFRK